MGWCRQSKCHNNVQIWGLCQGLQGPPHPHTAPAPAPCQLWCYLRKQGLCFFSLPLIRKSLMSAHPQTSRAFRGRKVEEPAATAPGVLLS